VKRSVTLPGMETRHGGGSVIDDRLKETAVWAQGGRKKGDRKTESALSFSSPLKLPSQRPGEGGRAHPLGLQFLAQRGSRLPLRSLGRESVNPQLVRRLGVTLIGRRNP